MIWRGRLFFFWKAIAQIHTAPSSTWQKTLYQSTWIKQTTQKTCEDKNTKSPLAPMLEATFLVQQFLCLWKKNLLHWNQSPAPEFQTFESKFSTLPVFIEGAFDVLFNALKCACQCLIFNVAYLLGESYLMPMWKKRWQEKYKVQVARSVYDV